MGVDFLLQHPQLIANHDDLVEECFERQFLGLKRGVRGVQNHFPMVPAGAKESHYGVGLFQAQLKERGIQGLAHKLRQRHFQASRRHLGLRRLQPAGFRGDGAPAGLKLNFRGDVAEGFDNANPVLRMASPHANVKGFQFHAARQRWHHLREARNQKVRSHCLLAGTADLVLAYWKDQMTTTFWREPSPEGELWPRDGGAAGGESPDAALLECGVDEVGIGSAIAEVYAAACILNPSHRINGLRDSKQLSPDKRKELSDRIKERALDYCIATASLEEIDRLNVFGATMLAMQRAVSGLKLKPGIVLIDGNRMPRLPFPARTIVKGDAKVRVISAASILAKVARDEGILKYHDQFPQYGFAQNKGYLTGFHLASLKQYGPCPVHRRNYEPIKALLDPESAETQLGFPGAEDTE